MEIIEMKEITLKDEMQYTDNLLELRDLYKFFTRYYEFAKKVQGSFEYQGIDKRFVNHLRIITNNLKSIDEEIELMLGEDV